MSFKLNMKANINIIQFPDRIKQTSEEKKKKYIDIRNNIEKLLTNYGKIYNDEWAVILAAGRYSSMRLQQIEGSDSTIKFFKNCIETQEKKI